ncbi:MotA/TolQ/ExbB proton channel family protein [Stenomitos frigidus]|uniref:Biopolymer transporter ExbB n=1 Tax=Stenomitos frigidus ULC18 TaxID=2107698 RepID=A0A2T1E0S9_9CYAN|nr:MotA/TolQ/ExbB proton channel family protein [Stenomitos frigidus]PSB26319.1 biopolymer transporter ExbB [Stenomitos frigidus ULC18]
MVTLFSLVQKGGVIMVPILLLSIGTIACALDRAWFWHRLLSQEKQLVHDILAAARVDLREAAIIAEKAQSSPISRFLLAALQLKQPSPETFRLAMETAADEEFMHMSRGNTVLEASTTIAPLLGLLGTVTGLIITFNNLNIGGGGSNVDLSKAAVGISEALITTAGGMIVAIIAASLLRLFSRLQRQQVDYFAQVGSKLELIYRHVWYEPHFQKNQTFSETKV